MSARDTVEDATKEKLTVLQVPPTPVSGTLKFAVNMEGSSATLRTNPLPEVPEALTTAVNVYPLPDSTPIAEPIDIPESNPSPTGSCIKPQLGCSVVRLQLTADDKPSMTRGAPPGKGFQRAGNPEGKCGGGHAVPGGCTANKRFDIISADKPSHTS